MRIRAGQNGVDGTIVIDGTVVAANELWAGYGTSGTITLNPGGSMTAATLLLGHGGNSVINHNGGTWSVGTFHCFYSGSGSTLNLNGNSISVSHIRFGAGGGSGTINRGGANILSAGDWHVDSGAVTFEPGDSAGGNVRAYNGGVLTLNANLTMGAGQEIGYGNNGSTLNLNGHNVTLSGGGIFHPGAFGAAGILTRVGGGNISAPQLQVDHGSDFTYESGDSFTDNARAYNGGKITLARALTLTGQLWISNNNGVRDAEVVMAGNNISVNQFAMNAGGKITRTGGGTITAQNFQIRDAGTIMDARPGDTATSYLDFYNNGVITVTQQTGDTTGLTLGNTNPDPANGMPYLNDFAGSQLNLVFDGGSGGGDWVFRWANQSGDNRVSQINTRITGSKINVSGATYEVVDGGDGYTYVRVPVSAISVSENVGARVNLTCNGEADGVIVLNDATGGTGTGYEYSKDGGSTWQVSTTFSGLTAGTYSMRAKDSIGTLTTPFDVTLTQPSAVSVTENVGAHVDADCNGAATGVIVLNAATGGSGPSYQYSKDGGSSWQASATFSGLAAAVYPMKARDGNGCESATVNVTITEPAAAVGGTIAKVISVTGYTGSIQWQKSADGSVWNDMAGETGASLDVSAHYVATPYFRAKVTVGAGCTPAYSSVAQMTPGGGGSTVIMFQ